MHTLRVRLTTFVAAVVFATSVFAAPGEKHRQARRWMEEAQQTSNPIRLLTLALDIKKALDAALAEAPEDVEVHLDLVRFHVMTPRIAGGSMDEARAHAAEIARRDAPLGHFARGYIAYREKQFGVARTELREAIRSGNAATKTLALKWLGWLSQESYQWDDAFAAFEQLRPTDVTALYEIARTSIFCSCRREEGKAALAAYLKLRPHDKEARKLLGVR